MSVGGVSGLPEGVYEHLITEELARALDAVTGLEQIIATVDDEEAPAALARHLARELERGLASLSAARRAEHARALTSRLLDVLADALEPADTELVRAQRPTEPARRLLALHRGAVPLRPSTPLATSTLLSSRKDPSFGHELSREAASADRIDAIIASSTPSSSSPAAPALSSAC